MKGRRRVPDTIALSTQELIDPDQKLWLDLYRMNYLEQRLFLRNHTSQGWSGDPEIDKPSWMVGDTTFRSNIWYCLFTGGRSSFSRVIDFHIALSDGSSLTDEKNSQLLTVMKLFLVHQVHSQSWRNDRVSSLHQRERIVQALKLLDWILIHDEVFNVGQNGLSLVTVDDLKLYIIKYTSPPVSESLYRQSDKLSEWLRDKIAKLTWGEFYKVINNMPEIVELPGDEERVLSLTDEEIVWARAYIVSQRMYKYEGGGVRFNAKQFQTEVYSQTFHGKHARIIIPPELSWGVAGRREFEGVNVKTPMRDGLTDGQIGLIISVVKRFCMVELYANTGLDINALSELSTESIRSEVSYKENERYTLLPYEVAFHALRESYRVQHQLGDRVFDALSYLVVEISGVRDAGLSCLNAGAGYFNNANIPLFGFDSWKLEYPAKKNDYAKKRNSNALYENYLVLVGCCLIIVGALAARRQEEIIYLKPNCLHPMIDPSSSCGLEESYFLNFSAGKTGNSKGAQMLKVEIPRMVARIIWRFVKFHALCVQLDFIKENSPLFISNPGISDSLSGMSPYFYNRCLDKACDFIQIPTVTFSDGVVRRFYIRQHQLRGFFATVFFWSSGFYSVESLRTVLGHSNTAHLIRYITKITPGSMLRVIKAERIMVSLANESTDIENLDALKNLLKERFGVGDIFISSAQEVIDNYSYLAEKGRIALSVGDLVAACNPEIFSEIMLMLHNKTIDLYPESIVARAPDGSDSSELHLVLKVQKVAPKDE